MSFEPVFIHVDESDGMDLGELHAVCALAGVLVHDDVLAELDLVALAILLEPGEAELVGGQCRDDVIAGRRR